MNKLILLVLIIIFIFILRFMYICHNEYFIGYSSLKDNIFDMYPYNIDSYYLLNKTTRDCLNKKNKNVIRDVSELMFNDNKEIEDIYDYTSVKKKKNYNMFFW